MILSVYYAWQPQKQQRERDRSGYDDKKGHGTMMGKVMDITQETPMPFLIIVF